MNYALVHAHILSKRIPTIYHEPTFFSSLEGLPGKSGITLSFVTELWHYFLDFDQGLCTVGFSVTGAFYVCVLSAQYCIAVSSDELSELTFPTLYRALCHQPHLYWLPFIKLLVIHDSSKPY